MHSLYLTIFDQNISITSKSNDLLKLARINFGAFEVNQPITKEFALRYDLKVNTDFSHFEVIRNESHSLQSTDIGLFIYHLEKDITVEIQYLCKELFFMHGAALEKNGELVLLTGHSGAGKSTTTWGLLNNGFSYLSDELAPINLESMHVSPYPHAVCLKSHPPLYPLPEATLKTTRTMHVPVELLPCKAHLESFPLTKIIIVEYSADNKSPALTKLRPAEACMNIYTNGLNQLAHEQDGLAAATKIATSCDCYTLAAAKLDETCELINTLF